MKLVCIGDSLTSGFGVFKDERWTDIIVKNYNLNILNKGINGDTTAGMLSRFFEDVISMKPSHVIIMGGCNDLLSNRSVKNIEINIEEMIRDALENNIIPIIATEIPIIENMAKRKWSQDADYSYVKESSLLYREWILTFSNYNNILCLDFYKLFEEKLKTLTARDLYVDGLHPTALGHKFMAEEAVQIIFECS